MYQYQYLNYNKYYTNKSVNRENWVQNTWEPSVLYSRFFHKSKTALKINVLYKKTVCLMLSTPLVNRMQSSL